MPEQKINISFVIPCFNEEKSIAQLVANLNDLIKTTGIPFEIIVVNDGSADGTAGSLANIKLDTLKVLHNPVNRGYGYSIKRGIEIASFEWIGIIDADGTYPYSSFPDLIQFITAYDMIVGERTGSIHAIPLLRRPAKWFLNRLASYLSCSKIRDVNSGMRLFPKSIVRRIWRLIPDGFSLTTTLTMVFLTENLRVKFVTIPYLKRLGKSKIRPVRDTYQFILLVLRLCMLFNPLRIVMPLFFFTLFLFSVALARDILIWNLSETSLMLFFFAIIIILFGLIADLINRRFPHDPSSD